jgi:hypothetical protein
MEYQEVEETIEVPKNTGVDGFLSVVKGILNRPRVQGVIIDARGKVTYRYYVRKGQEHSPLNANFETLLPYMAIRNGTAVELEADPHASVAVGQLFDKVAVDHLFPVAFVGGAQSKFWNWYAHTANLDMSSREELYGLPFLTDRNIPDEVLILAAAYTRSASLIDIQKSYKIVIPQVIL